MNGLIRSKLVLSLAAFVMIVTAIAIPLSSSSTHTRAQGTVTITEFPTPTSNSQPEGITSGPDGNIWFTETNGNKIGQITPNGAFTEFPIPTSSSNPDDITSGPDGNLWFTEAQVGKIGKITTSGIITEYPLPNGSLSFPAGITSGPDGNIWFADFNFNYIGRITPSGTITTFSTPTSSSNPADITTGPDGNLWFTEARGKIGKITTSGIITEYPIPTSSSYPVGITSGPDGNLWFAEFTGSKIGKITTSGIITEYPTPTNSSPRGITSGPDGNIWFTGAGIGQITPSGAITMFPAGGIPWDITTGPDGNLWFVGIGGNTIGRVNLSSTTPTPSPSPSPSPSPNPLVTQWHSPQNGFYNQGDHVTLSVSVTSGASQITGVTFTASWDSNTNVPICNGGLTNGQWVCQWSMKYNGGYVRNGSIAFGYTVTTATQTIVNPNGTRSGTIVYELTDDNPIYAGYATGSQNDAVTYTKAVARWTVPKATCGVGEISKSAIWDGIAGKTQLAQIATESNCNLGKPKYIAQWGLIPLITPAQTINKTVAQGDKMVATVAYVSSNNTFKLTLVDSGKWTFTITTPALADPSERTHGECIVEAPQGGNLFIWPLTNFGTVSLNCQVDGKPVANGPENIKFVMVSNVQKALTNPLATNGEVFTVVWKHT